jgi:hypothetical protein
LTETIVGAVDMVEEMTAPDVEMEDADVTLFISFDV